MSRGISIVVCSLLLLSVSARSWGSAPQPLPSDEWDLWKGESDGSSVQAGQKDETPVRQQAPTEAAAPRESAAVTGQSVRSSEPPVAKTEPAVTHAQPPGSDTVEGRSAPITGETVGAPVTALQMLHAAKETAVSDDRPSGPNAVRQVKAPGSGEINRPDVMPNPRPPGPDPAQRPETPGVSADLKKAPKEAGPENTDAHEAAGSVPAGIGDDYLIGPGDVLDISVWKDEALSRTVVVLPDGTITFPLIGKITVLGRTVVQVRDEMMKQLIRYVPELELSMEVKQSNSMIVYILGRVNAPGRQILNSNINVLQALAMAGGLTPFAHHNKIKVFRKNGAKTEVLPFRYSDVIDGELETNIELKRGDVIVVP